MCVLIVLKKTLLMYSRMINRLISGFLEGVGIGSILTFPMYYYMIKNRNK